MGIPSYFSYIIKNYTNIIRKFNNCERFQFLLMDSNSIIYDVYRDLEEKYKKQPFDVSDIEWIIIKKTIEKILEYIEYISPEKLVYITFDGVAPFAKMTQQRLRRYKTQFTANTQPENKSLWNTSAITPGTNFMIKLSFSINEYFKTNKLPMKVITSCSDEPGEGEHKLFEYIRTNDCKNDNIAVYGLDADLIMLSNFHLHFTKNIFVFREAPNFKTVISGEYKIGERLFMDIQLLASSIFQEMGTYPISQKKIRVHDYIFMCFLLGNDFLPHFPCLNIRTHGMQILMDNYNITIGKYHDRFLIDPVSSTISWKNVKLFMGSLAKREKELLLQECTARDKWDGRTWSSNTPAEVEQMILNLPMIYRQDEKYINVSENGWERRYRERLQVVDGGKDYLEGLEWVYNYYIGNRVSWRWHYKYNYTPLLIDVVKEIDVYTTREKQFSIEDTTPADNYTQLAYVLPYENLHLVPQSVQDIIKEKYLHLYPKKIEFSWAFCRFFWESKMIKH